MNEPYANPEKNSSLRGIRFLGALSLQAKFRDNELR